MSELQPGQRLTLKTGNKAHILRRVLSTNKEIAELACGRFTYLTGGSA